MNPCPCHSLGMQLIDAAMDLFFQELCSGCGSVSHGLCSSCYDEIMKDHVRNDTRPGIVVPLWSGGVYSDPLKRVISQAKDHQQRGGIPVLSIRLALAAASLVDECRPQGKGVLIPIPSQPRVVRRRGLDFTATLAHQTSRHLSRLGLETQVSQPFSYTRVVHDQSRLATGARQDNLHRSLAVRREPSQGWIVLVDDVVTTGASLKEAYRALTEAGHMVEGMATIATTTLRHGQSAGEMMGHRLPTKASSKLT